MREPPWGAVLRMAAINQGLYADYAPTGTLGDAALDATFTREARTAMTEGTSRTLFLGEHPGLEILAVNAPLLLTGSRIRCATS